MILILYTEDPKVTAKKLLELINEFGQAAGTTIIHRNPLDMKKGSIPLTIREMEIKNYNEISPHTSHNGYHQKNPQTINAQEGVKKKEPSYTVGGDVNWYNHFGEQYGSSLKN